jgi:hypothetical protein
MVLMILVVDFIVSKVNDRLGFWILQVKLTERGPG